MNTGTFEGYGVKKNGKPYGIWPKSYEWCAQTVERLTDHGVVLEIVPVYTGAAIEKPVTLPGINKGESA